MSLQSTAGSPTPPPTARTTTTTGGPAMHGDDAQPEGAVAPANDNAPVLRTAAVAAALPRLAEAIGRQIPRAHIPQQIGRAPCREEGCRNVRIWVVAVPLKKNKNK